MVQSDGFGGIETGDQGLQYNFGAVQQIVLQHQGPQEELDNLGKMVDMISDYQDDDGFNSDDVIKNAPAYLDVDNSNDPLNLERFFQDNKFQVLESDKDFLENVAIRGMIK